MFIVWLPVNDFTLCGALTCSGERWNVNTVHLDTVENNLNIHIIFHHKQLNDSLQSIWVN